MIEYMDTGDGYRPGACNIGPEEIRRRQQAGIAGTIATVAVAFVLLIIDAPAWSRLFVAVPAMLALTGFIQARTRFCAAYGLAGLRNLGGLGEQARVADPAAQAADRRRALQIFGGAALGGIAIGIAFALLPL